MDDEQFQAWLAQHGGEVGRKDNEKEAEGPLNPQTGVPTKVTAIDSTTIMAKDGATITLRRNPGPYVGNATMYTVVANTPPKESASETKEGDIRGSQTGPTREVYRGGKWVVETNPVYQAPASQTPTTSQIEGTPDPSKPGGYDNERPIMVTRDARTGAVLKSDPLTAAERKQWEEDRQRSRNPGGLTDEQRQAQQATAAQQQGAIKYERVDGHPELTHVVVVKPATPNSPATTEDWFEDANHNRVPSPTDMTYSVAREERNGQIYTISTATPKGGGGAVKTTVYDQNGNPVANLPDDVKETTRYNPDTGKYEVVTTTNGRVTGVREVGVQGQQNANPGPNAPQIVLGHSTDALRQYGDTLNQAVADGTLTPAQATQRWNQAVQTAQVAYNEATILQREQESNLNASTQLATNRLSNATSGFNTALQVVANLNDKLPVGSDLGGKAFAAILGLQMAHAQRMGAYDNIRPGSQPSVRDIMSQPSTSPPPAGPAASPAAPPPPAAESAPPTPPAASPAVDQAPESTPPEPPAGEPESALPNFTDPTTGRFGIPGSFVTGPYSPPAAQAPGGEGGDYPVLAGLAPPPAPPPPTPTAFTSEPTYGSLPPALLYTMAASTPPWRLSEDQVNQMRAAGVPENTIWSTPGMVAA